MTDAKKATPVEELVGYRLTNKRRKQIHASRNRKASPARLPQDYLQKFYKKAQGFSLRRLNKLARRLILAVDEVPKEFEAWKAELAKDGVELPASEWPGRPQALAVHNLLKIVELTLKARSIPVPGVVAGRTVEPPKCLVEESKEEEACPTSQSE